MELAQSRLLVGQDSFVLGWGRKVEPQKKKMSEFGGQEGLCVLRNDEREALGSKDLGLEKVSNQIEKRKSLEFWDSLIHQFTLEKKVPQCNCVERAMWQQAG